MITLIKNGTKKEFTERSAKIAVESFGWQEVIPLKVPAEIGTKTRPPEIRRPIEPIVLKPVEEKKEPVKETEKIIEPVLEKKTRKSPVRSKTTKK